MLGKAMFQMAESVVDPGCYTNGPGCRKLTVPDKASVVGPLA